MGRSWFWGGYHCCFTYPLTVAIIISAYFYLHAMVTGVNIPYPDPTPEQVAMEKYHQPILTRIFLLAVLAWASVVIGGLIWMTRYLLSGGK